MNCTLSADHRVIDGAIGSEFLGQFKDLIEHPITILPQQTIGEYGL
jgi:pyruvate dehydrogenase E2 component (dihydrolipoamide acetyltransferase)